MLNAEQTDCVIENLAKTQEQLPETTPDSWGRTQWLASVLVSLAVASFCLLQRKIEICDLGSHLYNTWLTQLVRAGQAPGLELRAQWCNTLFDRILEVSVAAFGFSGGEKIATILALLVFFWGLFALASAAAGKVAWKVTPLIAVFSYGWVFSMGLMNMYLSLGLMFATLAVIHKARGLRLLWLVPLLVLTTMAHQLGTAGVLGLGALLALLRWKKGWKWELGGVLAGMVFVVCALRWAMASLPTLGAAPDVSQRMFGFDQLILFHNGYLPAMIAVMIATGVVFFHTLYREGWPAFSQVRLWLLLLVSIAVLLPLLPNGFVTQHQGMVGMLPQRVSLIAAAILCCVMAGMFRSWGHCAILGIAVLPFFYLYYHDAQNLNELEARIEQVVKQLPPGTKVTSSINTSLQSRVSCTHMLDRACIGHCFSYSNYEPSSGQFRLRAPRENSIVTANWMEALEMEDGRYFPKNSEQPLYLVYFCPSSPNGICVGHLKSR
jgi:hypothetical protein